jgi:preprotein translocase subunit SecD
MTIRGQHGKHPIQFYRILVTAVLAAIFATALTAAGLCGDQTGKHTLELRLASHQEVKGWERSHDPEPAKAPVWISPEVALNNSDIARAYVERTSEGKPCVGIMLTEEGTLKLARLTKSHIGELLAIMVDGRVHAVPKIMDEITGGLAQIHGIFTEGEAAALAKGIIMK